MPHLPAMLISSPIHLSPADAARGADQGSAVIEIVTFSLLPGVDPGAFLFDARGTAAALAEQPGFVRRHLLRDDAGVWTDLVEWRSLPDAHAAAAAMMQNPAFGPFMAAIDPASVVMRHLPVVWRMD